MNHFVKHIFFSYNDVSPFTELQSWLENDYVDDIDDVSNDVQGKPQRNDRWVMIREGHTDRYEPQVIVEGNGHKA